MLITFGLSSQFLLPTDYSCRRYHLIDVVLIAIQHWQPLHRSRISTPTVTNVVSNLPRLGCRTSINNFACLDRDRLSVAQKPLVSPSFAFRLSGSTGDLYTSGETPTQAYSTFICRFPGTLPATAPTRNHPATAVNITIPITADTTIFARQISGKNH